MTFTHENTPTYEYYFEWDETHEDLNLKAAEVAQVFSQRWVEWREETGNPIENVDELPLSWVIRTEGLLSFSSEDNHVLVQFLNHDAPELWEKFLEDCCPWLAYQSSSSSDYSVVYFGVTEQSEEFTDWKQADTLSAIREASSSCGDITLWREEDTEEPLQCGEWVYGYPKAGDDVKLDVEVLKPNPATLYEGGLLILGEWLREFQVFLCPAESRCDLCKQARG